ncbi:hypothetical protein A3G62_03685 [Candidatus Kaiserbacteria bacterium RIFCSPLOWO2_12_FULL_50_10]|nr:MAG: hypothetical protein A3G62_03685 [Candidatus Kaiserbacteria bacterium RIFCSPLOWO2_12_FULL_50_10]
MLTFKPQQVTSKFLKILNDRTRDVLEKRYGLTGSGTTHTLESIGELYGITRERVRQIENHGVQTIQRSKLYDEHASIFDELEVIIRDHGMIVDEAHLLDSIAARKEHRPHILLLLNVGKQFARTKENQHFTDRWHIDTGVASAIEDALHTLANSIEMDDLVSETELFTRLRRNLARVPSQYHTSEHLDRWLRLTKRLDKNPLGEWGLVESSNVRTKGVRDYAYLIVKRHGSPMHFREVAQAIEETFGRAAHIATTHNELIKDDRFVLVGRGLYALTEWGYTPGVVKDVILAVLEKHGALTKTEIIDHVRKERYVKDNTIVVNLQDLNLFAKTADGKYRSAL